MIRITALYPKTADGFFDFDYYANTHTDLAHERLNAFGLISVEIQRCVSSIRGDAPAFVCITHMNFEDRDRMMEGFSQHGPHLQADFSNYSNITPVITICEIVRKT